jgi:hypothetical protein
MSRLRDFASRLFDSSTNTTDSTATNAAPEQSQATQQTLEHLQFCIAASIVDSGSDETHDGLLVIVPPTTESLPQFNVALPHLHTKRGLRRLSVPSALIAAIIDDMDTATSDETDMSDDRSDISPISSLSTVPEHRPAPQSVTGLLSATARQPTSNREFSPRYSTVDVRSRQPAHLQRAMGAVAEAPLQFRDDRAALRTPRRRSVSSPALIGDGVSRVASRAATFTHLRRSHPHGDQLTER